MPSMRLNDVIPHACSAGDVVGVHASGPGLNPAAVDHVALVVQTKSLKYGDPIDARGMGPAERPHVVGPCDAHVVGQLPTLSALDRNALEAWVRDLRTRVAPLRYKVDPPFEVIIDRTTSKPKWVLCSCVGLLVEAFRQVLGSAPLDPRAAGMAYPATSLATLQTIFNSKFLSGRSKAGLPGSGPWRVVLPGHILHAFAYGTNTWPYIPNATDHLF